MSLDLSKIFSNETISRRDSLEAICNVGKITFLATTFPSFLRAQYYLDFKLTPFIYQNPWVKHEIINFLDQQEVIDALGFDPLNYKKSIILEVAEYSTHITEEFATEFRGSIWISAYLFSDKDPEPYFISMGLEKEKYQKKLEMLTELRSDPEMLKLSRGLTIVHEIAHVWEGHNEGSILTGHGVTYRIEVEVIENLYNSGKVDLEMCKKMFDFFEKYMNNRPTQPKTTIDRYFQEHFHNQNNK